jgi:hypothetical protein
VYSGISWPRPGDTLRSTHTATPDPNSTPANELEKLASDPEMSVRQCVATNSNTPLGILEKLLQDPDTNEFAADNPKLPPAALAMWQLAH